MDITKTDLILKFVLAAAGQEDPGNQQLGPIHLIKYTYLADLAYAKKNNGKTFTGTEWKFHRYGPWAPEVFKRIEPVVIEMGARETRYSNTRFSDDFVRYSFSDKNLYKQLEQELPFEVTSIVRRAIHQFGSDTQSLLNYVYNTEPMLKAAPGETLLFEAESWKSEPKKDIEKNESLTARERKKRKEKIRAFKEKMKKRFSEETGTKKLISPFTPPRYDEIYYEGKEWLDHLAGEPIEEQSGVMIISDDYWKSLSRYDPDVS